MTDRTFSAPLLIGTTASGSDWIAYPDRHTFADVATMVDRIGKFGGTPTAEALALVGQTVASVTVKITATQSDRLGALLPESLCGLTLLTSRVKGTREQLATALDFLDEDLAWEFMLPQLWTDEETQTDFAERQVRASVANLRRRIRAAL